MLSDYFLIGSKMKRPRLINRFLDIEVSVCSDEEEAICDKEINEDTDDASSTDDGASTWI